MNNDFINVIKNKNSITRKLKSKLDDFEKICTKNKIPFCYRCAKIDYEDKVSNIVREALRKNKDIKPEDLKLPELDLNKYTEKNFKEISYEETWEKARGTGIESHTGFTIDYKCNIRGCGRSIFYTVNEYNKLKNIKDKTDKL